MASRSYIGRLRSDNQVVFVYCHSCAYMDVNGALLQEFYTNTRDVARLISGGAMSYIDEYGKPSYYVEQGNADLGVAIYTQPLEHFLTEIYDICTESVFLWRDGEWWVQSYHIEDSEQDTQHRLREIVHSGTTEPKQV